MTLEKMIALIRRRLGFRRDLYNEILFELDAQQRELENMPETPWFLKQEINFQNEELLDVGDVSFVPPQYSDELVLPNGQELLNIYEYGGLWYKETTENNQQWKKLHRLEKEIALGTELVAQAPCYYDPDEVGVIKIIPQPDKIYDFKLIAYVRDVAPSLIPLPVETQSNKWMREAHELLAWKVVESLASDLAMKNKVEEAASRVMLQQTKLDRQKITKLESDRFRTVGEDQ